MSHLIPPKSSLRLHPTAVSAIRQAQPTSVSQAAATPSLPLPSPATVVPRAFMLDNRRLQVGSFALPQSEREQILLAAVLKTPDTVIRTADKFRYNASVMDIDGSSDTLAVTLTTDSRGNLLQLQARNLTRPSENTEAAHCLKMKFWPENQDQLRRLPNELQQQMQHTEKMQVGFSRIQRKPHQVKSSLKKQPHAKGLSGNQEPSLHTETKPKDLTESLTAYPEVTRNFVKTHFSVLQNAGFALSSMVDLAANIHSPEHRDFVLVNCEQLHKAGFKPNQMFSLAFQPAEKRHFVMTHAQTLYHAAFEASEMISLASHSAEDRDFVLIHWKTLQSARFNGQDMLHLLTNLPSPIKRSHLLANCIELDKKGFTPSEMVLHQ